MSAVTGCLVADCATMGECKASSVGMPEHCQRQDEIAALKADLREAYVEAAYYLSQLMAANEHEVDLAQKARFEELRALTWR